MYSRRKLEGVEPDSLCQDLEDLRDNAAGMLSVRIYIGVPKACPIFEVGSICFKHSHWCPQQPFAHSLFEFVCDVSAHTVNEGNSLNSLFCVCPNNYAIIDRSPAPLEDHLLRTLKQCFYHELSRAAPSLAVSW